MNIKEDDEKVMTRGEGARMELNDRGDEYKVN